jgi:hypothetical protein
VNLTARNDNHAILRATTRFLLDELDRLASEQDAALTALAQTRLLAADRLAAIRAALGAARDGEIDPLGYLRDQLADEAHRSGR